MLKKISFENFKSLHKNEVEFRGITLLTGINSSGKSTLIQGVLLIKQNIFYIDQFLELKSLNLNPLNLLKDLKLNGEYVDLGIGKDILYENAKDDKIKINIITDENNVSFEMDTLKNLENDVIPCNVEIEKDNCIFKKEKFQYLKAERVGTKEFYEASKSKINLGNLGNLGEYTAHFLAENKALELYIKELKHPDAVTNELLENTARWLSNISKGIDIKSEIIPDLRKVKLSYSYDGGKKDYLPKDIGFGITYVLPIIVSILKSKPGDVIVIENPESHLHPAGQVQIAKLCSLAANAGVQMIIESHSDHFLNGIRVAVKENVIKSENIKIYYFNKSLEDSKSEISNIAIDSNGKILNWPKGFFDEWDIQLEKLLW